MAPSGLTANHLMSSDGTLVHIPYRIISHGIVVSRPGSRAIVVVLPATSVEDPKFGPFLNRNGLYRVEDQSGRVARIGQGRILDRVRRHRSKIIVFPHRVIAAAPALGAWDASERCYLEAQLADRWLAQGHALASSVFIRDYPALSLRQRQAMNLVLDDVCALIAAGLRIEERDNPLGFRPVESPGPSPARRSAAWFRQFAAGTSLEYTDGRIHASAIARRNDVLLLPQSLVHLEPSRSVGLAFLREHQCFLREAAVLDLGGGVGRTQRPVTNPTAAGLIKRITAGRIHNADKWRPTDISPSPSRFNG